MKVLKKIYTVEKSDRTIMAQYNEDGALIGVNFMQGCSDMDIVCFYREGFDQADEILTKFVNATLYGLGTSVTDLSINDAIEVFVALDLIGFIPSNRPKFSDSDALANDVHAIIDSQVKTGLQEVEELHDDHYSDMGTGDLDLKHSTPLEKAIAPHVDAITKEIIEFIRS